MQEDIREFVAERDWNQFHDPKNLAMAIASEAGELLSELRWVDGESADAHCRTSPQGDRVADELADITICLLMMADRMDLDLPTRVHEKLKKIREKYPAEEWAGRSGV